MKSHYRVVIIGGGIVGSSILYHLSKFGWTDVALIERAELTAGSTWHAAAGFHALNDDPNIAALQGYTIRLYEEIEKESGQSVGMHMTGGISLAATPERWEMLKAERAMYETMEMETRLVTPEEIKALCPIVDVANLQGGLYDQHEGYMDPHGTTHAYAGAAKKRGAEIILRNRVLDLKPLPNGWSVVTEQGTITAEHVVNAAGLWARKVGRMVGINLPVTPMQHHYLITEDVPEIVAMDREIAAITDLEGFTYLQQERKGVLLGVYERDPRHWKTEGADWDFGMDLLPPDIDRISPELAIGFERFPALAERRHPQVGQRRLHLHARRQSAGRPGAGPQELLGRLRLHGRLLARRRHRPHALQLDDPWRSGRRHLRHGRRALRRLRVERCVSEGDDRPVLRAALRHLLSQRGAARRPAAQDLALLRRLEGRGCGLWRHLGHGDAAIFRDGPAGLRREADPAPLQRPRLRRRRGEGDARSGRHVRKRDLCALRSDRRRRRRLARSLACGEAAEGRPRPPGADAESVGQPDGRPDRQPPGRGPLLADRLVLSADLAHALVRGASAATGRDDPQPVRRLDGLRDLRAEVARTDVAPRRPTISATPRSRSSPARRWRSAWRRPWWRACL